VLQPYDWRHTKTCKKIKNHGNEKTRHQKEDIEEGNKEIDAAEEMVAQRYGAQQRVGP
jgi:hypothetical protein